MEKSTLDKKLTELSKEYERDKNILIRDYCFSNNPYKVGDKFTDHIGSIIIEEIKYSVISLCCIYFGIELKKDGTPRKDGSKRRAVQTSEVKK
jgi:hypothetical protein